MQPNRMGELIVPVPVSFIGQLGVAGSTYAPKVAVPNGPMTMAKVNGR